MSSTEATSLMRELASPVPVKVALFEAAQALSGWTANRVRDVFHADPRVKLDDQEMHQLRVAVQQKREAYVAADVRELRQRLERIEALLRAAGADPDRLGDDLDVPMAGRNRN